MGGMVNANSSREQMLYVVDALRENVEDASHGLRRDASLLPSSPTRDRGGPRGARVPLRRDAAGPARQVDAVEASAERITPRSVTRKQLLDDATGCARRLRRARRRAARASHSKTALARELAHRLAPASAAASSADRGVARRGAASSRGCLARRRRLEVQQVDFQIFFALQRAASRQRELSARGPSAPTSACGGIRRRARRPRASRARRQGRGPWRPSSAMRSNAAQRRCRHALPWRMCAGPGGVASKPVKIAIYRTARAPVERADANPSMLWLRRLSG